MENKSTPLVDEHLQSMQGMKELGADDFFYTRLKARMEREKSQQGWSHRAPGGMPRRPQWQANSRQGP